MLTIQRTTVVALFAGLAMLTGCNDEHKADARDHAHPAPVTRAIATITPTFGHTAHGTVKFEQTGEHVHVLAKVAGLMPNATHAIHVHEYGNISADDGTAAGSHYNPTGHDHALPGEEGPRHAGDLGNLEADGSGYAEFHLIVDNMTVNGKYNPVLGRSVIIHAGVDKGRAAQPVGDAGRRIGQGVIGVAK